MALRLVKDYLRTPTLDRGGTLIMAINSGQSSMEQTRSTEPSTQESLPAQVTPNYQALDFLDVDGIKVHYKVAGVGEQILLLHGWGCSIESMQLVFDDFASHYAVLALDFPGHGESDLPPTAWGVSDYETLVLSVMDTLHWQRPHLIAHSFGGGSPSSWRA